ncbi:MAG TPA: hypothetical protein VFB12_17880 [Ktedonobacteraceae bacterium]|nr:hypothetical protein [Ktedonobacteraceae bacterium]
MNQPDRVIDSTVQQVQLSNTAQISRPYAPDSTYARSFKEMTFSAGVLLLGLVLLFGFVLGAIGAWHQFIGAMGAFFQFVAWALGVGIPAILIYTGARMTVRDITLHLGALQDIRIRRDANERENKLTDATVKMKDAEAERIYAEAEKIRTHCARTGRARQLALSRCVHGHCAACHWQYAPISRPDHISLLRQE